MSRHRSLPPPGPPETPTFSTGSPPRRRRESLVEGPVNDFTMRSDQEWNQSPYYEQDPKQKSE